MILVLRGVTVEKITKLNPDARITVRNID